MITIFWTKWVSSSPEKKKGTKKNWLDESKKYKARGPHDPDVI